LAEKLAARNKLLLGMLYFQERPVAAQLWILHADIASILKLAYDDTFREYSFGTILTYRLIMFAIDEMKVKSIDYLTGDDAYKKDWMSLRRERRGNMAFNRTIRGRILATSELGLKPSLKSVKRGLFAGFRRWRQLFREGRVSRKDIPD
jgi:CelD/BcsL family acetyltransferase involved in cellulose biosynthesis